MKKIEKFISLTLAGAMILSLASCGPKQPTETKPVETPTESATAGIDPNAVYERGDDEEVYKAVLGEYEDLLAYADSSLDLDTRYVRYAKAEADLLAQAAFIPDTTQGGTKSISRIAPRTVPYVMWGNDDDRLHSLVVAGEFLTPAERETLLGMWEAASKGEGSYDAATVIQWLKDNGHTVQTDYTYNFSTTPVTIDWLNTSSQSDTEITVNLVDGLVEYDNLGQMQPALAESWEVSEDGKTYTFHIRPGVYWYTSEGRQYAEVTAEDFVSGLRHMMDAQAGLEWLLDGIVVGATDYYGNGGSFDDVGYKAIDKYTLEVQLEVAAPYFMTMLTYSCFLPICTSFYESRGGVFGVEEYAAAAADDAAYTFGKNTDVASNVYCGPFLLQTLTNNSEIKIVRNTNYWNNEKTTLDSITWIYDDGSNLSAFYNDVVSGVYAGCNIGSAEIGALAAADGNAEKYGYVSDTTSTTYFGGLNLNRGTFAQESGAVASPKTEVEKISTQIAMLNKDFRWALFYAWDREASNAPTRGENALTNLRNMYTAPNFVTLSKDITDDDGHTFTAGTQYGDIVQYYCDKLDLGINVADGVNGWYSPERAKAAIDKAYEELGDSVQWPIKIDVTYMSFSDTHTASVAAFKESVERNLGSDKVVVNMVEATTSDDYYAGGYRAANGEAGNFDIFWGSGWGPDYGDPKSYLDTMKGYGAGYMSKVLGLF